MKKENGLISIYSGTEVSVHLLKGKLDMAGISSEIRKDSAAGTWGIVPENIDLMVPEGDFGEAGKIADEFAASRRVEKPGL
ncbi:MAG TPA: DUF2007 domain-containing protein [Bacteroidales bacterium]|jgi:hypothetical protein|nr:DUF2007 domain-containing protein [Bacteroidales bacterium]